MRIKLHNSLGKTDEGFHSHFYFNKIMYLYFNMYSLKFTYDVDDSLFFLHFSPKTKEFSEGLGFGIQTKETPSRRKWKDSRWNWEEMSG